MLRSQFCRNILVSSTISLLACSPALHAANSLPQLWPTFSEPTSIIHVNLMNTSASPDDTMAETTLIGAYNQLQGSTRLYFTTPNLPDSIYWLQELVPSGITVSTLSFTPTDPDGALKALLTNYGSSITGYIICDPVNTPASCDYAFSMAANKQAMVVNPDNLAVMTAYAPNMPLLFDTRNALWIQSNSTLVNNTTINGISNPSGGSGTTGWTLNGSASGTQTISTTSYNGATALKWTVPANAGETPGSNLLPLSPWVSTIFSTYRWLEQEQSSSMCGMDMQIYRARR